MERASAGQGGGPQRLRMAFAVLGSVWLVYAGLTITEAAPSAEFFNTPVVDLMYAALLLCAGLLCLARARGNQDEHRVWAAFGVGLTLWSFGDIWWIAFLAQADEVPYPSISDAFWLASYLPMAYGLLRLISLRVSWRALGPAAWLDGAIAAVAGCAVFAATLLAGPLAAAAQGAPMTFATNLAYPIGDLILLGVALAELSATGWRPGRAIGLIAAGLLLRALTDFVYLDQVTRGTYEGGILDTGWPAASLLVAAAACVPPSSSRRDPDWRAFLAPAVFVSLSLGLLVFDHFNRLTTVAITLAAVAIALAALRMVTMVRTTLASSRYEALTDALTGMKNRRSLKTDLDRVVERVEAGQSFVFAMFDLNGFKRYNDTFGHAAGDSLLTRLGTRLVEAAAPGSAYRLGGDEFCVLLPDGADTEKWLARADAALLERGEGFTISAARGSARIPAEAGEPEEAMHLADRRMYAAKLGGRGDGDHIVEALIRALHEAKPEMEEHPSELAELARDVSRRLGLATEELDVVVRAAKLHDVGKMAIPDGILSKPGPLDDDDWAYVRKHPLIGERIVAAAPPLAPVARLVRSSHERWDGGGYPDGLSGEAIPRGARIVFICAALDAMTRRRPYAPSRSLAEAAAELRRCSGSQFDPEVVEALLAILEERPSTRAQSAANGDGSVPVARLH